MLGTASLALPKNSKQTVRVCSGMRCKIQRALVIKPSQPSFCMPGRPLKNLSVTSLPNPSLRKLFPGMSRRSWRMGVLPSAWKYCRSKLATSASWILPRLCPTRVTSSHCASGVTMRQLARLSSAVPQSTAFLPPAFMAMLPPMQEASAEVGSTANTKPARSAASATRWVTTPASVQMVGTGLSNPDNFVCSTSVMASSFSVLMTALFHVSGTAPPVYPVPPPRGTMVKPKSIQPLTKPAISTSVSGVRTTNGYSTRQSVASVTWDTRDKPSNLMLSLAVYFLS